jgi:hypothetical protein
MTVPDNEMIAIIFPGEAIIVEGGKLCAPGAEVGLAPKTGFIKAL